MSTYGKSVPLLEAERAKDAPSTSGSPRTSPVFLMVTVEVVLVAGWVLMGEITQAFPNLTHYPAMFAGVSCASYVIFLIPWAVLRRSRGLRLPSKASLIHVNNIMLPLGLMWLVQIWFWYMSLKGMSVSVNTIIYQTTPLVVFFFDLFFNGPSPGYVLKLGCIVVAVFGIIVMSSSDTKESNGVTNSLSSCIEVSVATLLYGLFDVLYAQWAAPVCDKISKKGERITYSNSSDNLSSQIESMFLLLGLRAVPACMFLICTLLVGLYDQDLPDYSRGDLLAMLSVTVADWAFNIAMCIGLVTLSPLWVTMGTILCVPAALVFDMLVKGLVLSLGACIGAKKSAAEPVAVGRLAAIAVLELVLVTSWVLTGEIAQAFPNLTHYPAMFAGVSCASYVIFLIPWAVLRRSRGLRLPSTASLIHMNNIMLLLGFMWLLQMWAWYMSLKGMSVALNIIIYQTTPLVVFFIDLFINGTTPSYIPKLLCILLAVLGIIVMSASDAEESNGVTNSLSSCIEVSVATLLYGLFDVLYAQWAAPVCDKISKKGERITYSNSSDNLSSQIESMFLLLGLRAVPACIFLICTLLVGLYDHDLPDYSRADILGMVWVPLADWAFNIAMSIGLVLLSPLWVTMGTIPCVPTALIFDMLAKGLTLSVGAWMGALCTAVGFIAFNVISSREKDNTRHHCDESG
ncbi:hypothetical protein FOL46_008263 [Perkinsus olseni]|uniref:Uncharacterized protein n=1 Tax=Perkinsus olseni TaxID=32597 RepID=A0A7J6L898_PEROL|nr:hypothetical protein FOL46_008263 [Perkinsus olseni]